MPETRVRHSPAFILQTEEFSTLGKDAFENSLKEKLFLTFYRLKMSTLGVHTNYIVYLINKVHFNYPKYNLEKFIYPQF